MSDLPALPAIRLKSPSWLDGRLVVGVVLVLLSVLVGAKIIASSDHYDTIWAASRDLAPGTTLVKADLLLVNVRFKDHGGVYISAAGPSPVGRTTTAPLTSGQLIPLAALPSTKPVPVRLVTIPVAKLHMPSGNDLHGVQVDLYETPKPVGGQAQAAPQLILANVTIASTITDSALGGSDGSGVVLSVPLPYVDAVVAAAQQGDVDLVRVPGAGTIAAPSAGAVAGPAAGPVAIPSAGTPSAAASAAVQAVDSAGSSSNPAGPASP